MTEPNRSPRRLPSAKSIRRYWAPRLWVRKEYDSETEFLEPNLCFACGNATSRLDRAHITARVEGGLDTAENLHLLCVTCHKDSEYLDSEDYWRWFWERTQVDAWMSACARSGMNLWALQTEAVARMDSETRETKP